MSLLSINKLSCQQGVKTLFEQATFGVEEGDKIAVIGPNGSGKTTLLKELSMATEGSTDTVAIQQGLRITTLPQTPVVDPEHSISDHLFRSDTPAANAIRDYQSCLENLEEHPSPEAEVALTDAMAKMDHANAWEYESRVSSILRELNIHHLSQKMKTLSGGMKKKVALAQAFFEDSDILILDEPTNHLDIDTIEWLEGMLRRHPSAIIMVTHDRYFLDKICTKIVEIDQQQVFCYPGNYQSYLEQREARYAAQDKKESSIQSVLRVELAWLKRGPKARSTKQKARKQRIGEMIDRKTFSPEQALALNVSGRRLGKKILELKNVSKSFDDHALINQFSYTFKQGEKIGILGPNGSGKTTLLNLVTERLSPDSGSIDVGINTVFGYFDQHSQKFDLSMSVYDHVKQYGTQITCHDGSVLSAAKLLERFLFPSQMLKTQIGKLSGGERRRLHLVCLLLENPNFLLFDEPTNDLDIQTLSVLEDFLLTFAGCIIVISHDRYFMDRVVDQLLVFNETGTIENFPGNYSDYVDTLKAIRGIAGKAAVPDVPETIEQGATSSASPKKKRITNREREELKTLEKDIDRLETEKQKLDALFASGSGTTEEYQLAGGRLKEITLSLNGKLARWESLAESA